MGTKRLYWDATEVVWEEARASCPPNSTLAVVESAAEMTAMAGKGNTGRISPLFVSYFRLVVLVVLPYGFS